MKKGPQIQIEDDIVQPFRLEKTNIRGRVIRMGPVLQDIINRHDYPAPVSALLSEAITLCVLLSAMLKYEGIFTLQIKGDGPVRALVADATTDGKIRAYASFDEHAVKKMAKRKPDHDNHFFYLLGKGYVSFTVDQDRDDVERYQGIVELLGGSLMESVRYYFDQSEQIKTTIKLEIHPQDSQWRAGAVMLQHMPSEKKGEIAEDISAEDWSRSAMLMETVKEHELLSPNLSARDLLYRLFHEEGVRVYDTMDIKHVCRCSKARVENIIRALSDDEVKDILEEQGKIAVDCEFCSRHYSFEEAEVVELKEGLK